jgi:hypothetical protein
MNEQLERRYRRLLLAYPKTWRAANTDNMLGTLNELAEPNQTKPTLRDRRSLIANGIRARTFASSGGSPQAAVAEGAMRASLLAICIGDGGAVAGTFVPSIIMTNRHWVLWAMLVCTIAFLARPNRWTLSLNMLAPFATVAFPPTSALLSDWNHSPGMRMTAVVLGLAIWLPMIWCARSSRQVFMKRRLGWLGIIAVGGLEYVDNVHSLLFGFVVVVGLLGIGLLRLDPRPTATLVTVVGLVVLSRLTNPYLGSTAMSMGLSVAAVIATVGLLALITRIARPAFAT